MTSCPVVKTITELYSGGYVLPEDDNLVTIHGGAQIVCDDISFYITSRKLALAGIELKQDIAAFNKLFDHIDGHTYAEVYKHIIDTAMPKKYIYEQFMQLITLLTEMESVLCDHVAILAQRGQSINISIPSLALLPNIDQIIVYNPVALQTAMNQLIDYINKMNINALLKEPIQSKLEHISAPPPTPNMTQRISANSVKTFESMHDLLAQEMIVADYAKQVEKYQCEALGRIMEIARICSQIVDTLV